MLLTEHLEMDRCPHCRIANPLLKQLWQMGTVDHRRNPTGVWAVYICSHCGSAITAVADKANGWVRDTFPDQKLFVEKDVPERARNFLQQAMDSLHAPAGAIMLTASAVDAMLKEKQYKEGSLYVRIKKAVEDGLLTQAMGQWAHQVRLDANDQRHANENVPLPIEKDAERSIEFAKALAQFLFVLPARVARGIEQSKMTEQSAIPTE